MIVPSHAVWNDEWRQPALPTSRVSTLPAALPAALPTKQDTPCSKATSQILETHWTTSAHVETMRSPAMQKSVDSSGTSADQFPTCTGNTGNSRSEASAAAAWAETMCKSCRSEGAGVGADASRHTFYRESDGDLKRSFRVRGNVIDMILKHVQVYHQGIQDVSDLYKAKDRVVASGSE